MLGLDWDFVVLQNKCLLQMFTHFWPAISHMIFKVKRMFYTSKWTGECSERAYKVRATIG